MEGWLQSADTLDARQFHIAVKRLADSLSYGTDRSPFLGAGIEFVQSRPYQYGDPIRSIPSAPSLTKFVVERRHGGLGTTWGCREPRSRGCWAEREGIPCLGQ